MKSLLLTVTLFRLLTVLQAQDDLPFLSEDKNVTGTWYKKAIVSDRSTTSLKRTKKEFPLAVRALAKGNMEVTHVSTHHGNCIQVKFLMEKTKKPGQYRAFQANVLVYIYELPVMDHYIFYSESKFFEQKVYVGQLIGRDPKENPQALEEFKKFAQWKGFIPENIVVPEQRERCVPEVHSDAPKNCKSEANSASDEE